MRILIATPRFPYSNATGAGSLIVFQLVKDLSKKHEIYLVSRIDPDELHFVLEMKKYCKKVDTILKYSFQNAIFEKIQRIKSYISFWRRVNCAIKNGEIDIVQVEWFEAGIFLIRNAKIPMILDTHDIMFKLVYRKYMNSKTIFQKIKNYVMYLMISKIELATLRKFDKIYTKSGADKQDLLDKDKGLSISVLSSPLKKKDVNSPEIPAATDHLNLLFVGQMNRPLNIQAVLYFFENIFSLIKYEIPSVRLYIVGNKPPEVIKNLSRHDRALIVTGFVDQIQTYYEKATVFVAPILVGGGIIVKILDALTFGVPVVTTTYGNEGIRAKPGKEILIADTPKDFASCVIQLLNNPELRKKIAFNGKRFVKENFNWGHIIDMLESDYETLSKHRSKSKHRVKC